MISGALLEIVQSIIRREVDRRINARKHVRYGILDSYDPVKHAAKVRFQPEDVISGWIPIGTAWAGNGWGLFTPPTPGEQISVHYEGGDLESGVISTRHWGDIDKPLQVPAGEAWNVHKQGQAVIHKNDGSMIVGGKGYVVPGSGGAAQTESANAAKVHLDASGNVTLKSGQTGTVTVGSGTTTTITSGSGGNINVTPGAGGTINMG